MRANHRESIHLKVPFYRQHYDFTCGPASLMMAMKFFDAGLRLTKDLEIDIWREGNMVEVYGTSRYGLAYSAVVRGYCARVTSSDVDQIDFVDRLVPPVENLNMQMLKLHFYERRKRCKKLGVTERQRAVTEELIFDSLLSGYVPLMMTNALFCEGENLPHWVVVTGIDERSVYFNNPSDAGQRNRKLMMSELQKFVGYRDDQAIVEIVKPK